MIRKHNADTVIKYSIRLYRQLSNGTTVMSDMKAINYMTYLFYRSKNHKTKTTYQDGYIDRHVMTYDEKLYHEVIRTWEERKAGEE